MGLLPGTGAHLEFISGGDHSAAEDDPRTCSVPQPDDDASLAGSPSRSVKPINPWEPAMTLAGPEGCLLILARSDERYRRAGMKADALAIRLSQVLRPGGPARAPVPLVRRSSAAPGRT
jgi:hypothetical protein